MASSWPPALLSLDRPRTSRGKQAIEFIESYCRVTKESVGGRVGELIRLRPWQKKLLIGVLATEDGRLKHRQALIGMPRKSGKSTLLAGLVLWQLVMGPNGGEIYSIAGDREQAAIIHDTVKAMIKLDPELDRLLRVQQNVIVNDSTGTVYKKRSSEAGLSEGYNPTFVVVDEVHVVSREMWDVMALGSGARFEPLMVGITTAGIKTDRFGKDSLAYAMYQMGKRIASGEIDDPGFYFAWWEAEAGADYMDEEAWAKANPGLGDLSSLEEMRSTVLRTPEAEWLTKRCNMWVSSMNNWLPTGAWAACESDLKLSPGEPVVFGFDGSRTNDCTALVVASVGDRPHIEVLRLWERPPDDEHWRVRSDDVMPVIRELADLWNPTEIVVDPAYWRDDLEDLSDEGYPVVEFSQRILMPPAAQSFYEAVMAQRISHDGDGRLSRHLENTVVKLDAFGCRLMKEHRNSGRKIDLTVAAVMAFRRATQVLAIEKKEYVHGAEWMADPERKAKLIEGELASRERVQKMIEEMTKAAA